MNDVLSGRGAWFNQHPGNKHFRRMLEEQKAVYMAGTKKQKMDISKAIVEAIYLKTPPGRFLKKCPDTGQWNELSTRDAADRAAQAMAYAIKGESLKEKRRQRRSSRKLSKDEVDDNDVGRKSSQSSHRSTHNQQHATTDQLRDNASSSSAAHHGLDTRRAGAVGTSNDMPSASELLHVLGNSNLQQQLLLQRLQQPSTTTTTLPTSSVNSIDNNVDQHGLAQLLAQAMQQQQQQQLPLHYTVGQNPLGQLLQSQTTPLQPSLLEGLTHQLLHQAQQQQQHNDQQQQLLLQRLSNQQNVPPSASLLPALSLAAPFLTGPQSQPANDTLLQNLQLQSNTPSSNALLLSSVLSSLQHQPNSSGGISNAPQGAQQADQLQRSLMLQQNQLLVSSLSASSSNQLPFQQQQLQPLDPLLQQTLQATLQFQQNLQGLPPPAPINNSTGIASANVVVAAAQPTRREESEDKVHSGPEEDDYCGD
eukprot:scaffold7767_cov86-Skeletonema_dohrnii-CCMP3373.AAC.3